MPNITVVRHLIKLDDEIRQTLNLNLERFVSGDVLVLLYRFCTVFF
jgi:hypothetical protein